MFVIVFFGIIQNMKAVEHLL